MAAGGHFGCSKITFDCISSHIRSIVHFGCLKFTFDSNSGHFRSIQNFIVFFGGHFGSQFLPFQIDTQLFIYFLFFDNGHFGLDDNVSYRTRPRYLDE